MDDNVLKIVNEARNSLAPFCIEECKSLCCKKGSLILFNSFEIEIIAGDRITEYFENSILITSSSGNTIYDLIKAPCKHLGDDFCCKIHNDKNRPKVCSDFPIFITDNYIITSDACPAIKKGILDDYLKKLEKLGLKLI